MRKLTVKSNLIKPIVEEWKFIRSNRNLLIIFCAIILIGIALRLIGLTHQSMWLDEANGIRIAKKPPWGIISELQRDVSPPLHYFLLYIWMKIFGSGELSTRFFASIFGILLVPAIYYVGKDIFNRKIGLISAFLAAIARFHIRYSQEVRMYSMLSLLGLLSMYFLYKAVKTDDKSSWHRYAIFAILTIYSHNYGLFIAASGVVFFVICFLKSENRSLIHQKRFLISLLIIAAAYLPWFPVFIMGQFGSPAITGWLSRIRPYHIYETFKVHSGLDFWIFKDFISMPIVWLGFCVFFACFVTGILSIKMYKGFLVPYVQKNMELTWLLCYYFVTLGIPILVSIFKPIYVPNRYSIAAWPAFPLILGVGISKIKNFRRLLTVLCLIFLISSISLCHYYFIWVKSYDRDMAGYIESKGSKGDVIVFAPSFLDVSIDYYLKESFKELGYPWRSFNEPYKGRRRYWRSPSEMVNLARSGGKVFLVCQESVNWIGDIRGVKRTFNRSFSKIESKKFGDSEIIVYR